MQELQQVSVDAQNTLSKKILKRLNNGITLQYNILKDLKLVNYQIGI